MNCVEFLQTLPEGPENHGNPEFNHHLNSCPACEGLAADLDLISREAVSLAEYDDPPPRVWNAIALQLRQEGLIRDPQQQVLQLPAKRRRWNPFLIAAPLAAVLVLAGVLFRGDLGTTPTRPVRPTAAAPILNQADQQILESVAAQTPELKNAYKENLERVNVYIDHAEVALKANPEDQAAQQELMDAYEQKNMVYAMAMDRASE